MTNDKFQLLNVRRQPGRMNIEDAGVCLGFALHEMRVLVAAGLISPLGKPLPSGVKYFASAEIERLRCDAEWLAKACDCIAGVWQSRNQKLRKDHPAETAAAKDRTFAPRGSRS